MESVVDSVFTPFLTTGVANPLLNGATALRPARPRSPWERFRASRRDAMGAMSRKWMEDGGIECDLKGRDRFDDGREVQICRSSKLVANWRAENALTFEIRS